MLCEGGERDFARKGKWKREGNKKKGSRNWWQNKKGKTREGSGKGAGRGGGGEKDEGRGVVEGNTIDPLRWAKLQDKNHPEGKDRWRWRKEKQAKGGQYSLKHRARSGQSQTTKGEVTACS